MSVKPRSAIPGLLTSSPHRPGALLQRYDTTLVVEIEWTRWKACFDVNVGGVFLISQAVAPLMQAAGGGRIINTASFAVVPSVASTAYSAWKSAVVQLVRVLASELGPWGLTVNAYAPGMVPTAMNGFAEMPHQAQVRLLETLSLRRWKGPDDVANVLIFLASDTASYITDTLLEASGGRLATQIPARAYGTRGGRGLVGERPPRSGSPRRRRLPARRHVILVSRIDRASISPQEASWNDDIGRRSWQHPLPWCSPPPS